MNYTEHAKVLSDLVIKYQELVLVYQARERDYAMYSHPHCQNFSTVSRKSQSRRRCLCRTLCFASG